MSINLEMNSEWNECKIYPNHYIHSDSERHLTFEFPSKSLGYFISPWLGWFQWFEEKNPNLSNLKQYFSVYYIRLNFAIRCDLAKLSTLGLL